MKLIYLLIPLLILSAWPAQAHIGKGKLADPVAEIEYRMLLDFQPKKNDIRNKLGMVLYRMNKLKEAKKQFNTVLKNDPANFNATDALGLIMLKQQNTRAAAAQFKKAKALNPADPLVYYHLGQAYIMLKKIDEARNALQTAAQKASLPNQPAAVTAALPAIKKALKDIK
ncbi:tetratricopeptide repeat protein [Desulfobacterota bacterium M19]